jgi:hypothetical protein
MLIEKLSTGLKKSTVYEKVSAIYRMSVEQRFCIDIKVFNEIAELVLI